MDVPPQFLGSEEEWKRFAQRAEGLAAHRGFKITGVLASGFAAVVFAAESTITGARAAFKVTQKTEARQDWQFYKRYVFQIYNTLSHPEAPSGVLIPQAWGESEDCFYEVFALIDPTQTLASLIAESAPLHPTVALRHLAEISAALDRLHSRGILHADLKPSNILVQGAEGTLALIDFGMARPTSDQSVYFVGTWAYMHPALRAHQAEDRITSATRVAGITAEIGPYIDVYAAAIIGFEMLTGEAPGGKCKSCSDFAKSLRKSNPWMRAADPTLAHHAASLLWQMMNTQVGPSGISAHIVSATASSLARDFEHIAVGGAVAPRRSVVPHEGDLARDVVAKLEQRLGTLRDELLQATATFVAEAGRLRDVDAAQRDETTYRELGLVFGNALSRTRVSWWVGVGMTGVCFGVIVAMIGAAVTLSLTSGVSKWGVVFGTGSVATVLGTLLWKPYDRAFRATIVAQQIENIHVKTVAGFRCAPDFEKRMALFDNAQAELGKLLQTHATSAGQGTLRNRSGKRPKSSSRK
jgi:serine/threonine protein kinase